ncbi:hypothetical protein [Cupriavidus basilensis]|uniref:hypothetical protein n=1 Tax=Cupriavidus basilensis TaxID=68895 RepID=UPI0020A69EBE|nr:hypothetical protein [Cupriavidus basilensis]MCP3024558.1 hypothetical protein [Cupriavidus basilensis]
MLPSNTVVLIPDAPLALKTPYTAKLIGTSNGQPINKSWSFTTQWAAPTKKHSDPPQRVFFCGIALATARAIFLKVTSDALHRNEPGATPADPRA